MPLHYAIFGGSFNPIHKGHVAVVEQLLQLEAEKIVIMPTSRSPFKLQQPLLPNALRLKMIQQTFQDWERVKICDFEIKSRQARYTYHTLRYLQKQHTEVIWHLVLGWDTFQEFPQWKNARDILSIASLWVVKRPSSSISNEPCLPGPMLQAPLPQWFEGINWDPQRQSALYEGRELVRYFEFDTPRISSTEIRDGHAGIEWLPSPARSIYANFRREMEKKKKMDEKY